jgi:hypothetical protein
MQQIQAKALHKLHNALRHVKALYIVARRKAYAGLKFLQVDTPQAAN